MVSKRFALVLAGVLGVVVATPAAAQTACTGNPCSVTNTASVTVGTVLRLALSSSATALTAPDSTAYNAGFQDNLAALTATVKANRGWTLNVKAGVASWTAAGAGARAAKPAGDLQFSSSGGAPFTALTTADQGLATSASGTPGATSTISYRTLWDWTLDTPGTYSLDVVFTVTAP